jgi:phage host-nuclease inhibitor protein Gam
MSKKIAQLTKVIFHLHTKNEENALYQTSLTNCHEKEMEQILKEANDIIIRQKNEIDKLKNNSDLKEKVKELEQQHIKERRDSQREFEVYKQAMAEKEAHLEKEYRDKTVDMKENLQEIKKRFDSRCEDYKK